MESVSAFKLVCIWAASDYHETKNVKVKLSIMIRDTDIFA